MLYLLFLFLFLKNNCKYKVNKQQKTKQNKTKNKNKIKNNVFVFVETKLRHIDLCHRVSLFVGSLVYFIFGVVIMYQTSEHFIAAGQLFMFFLLSNHVCVCVYFFKIK